MGKSDIVITVRAISKNEITHLNICLDYTNRPLYDKIFHILIRRRYYNVYNRF